MQNFTFYNPTRILFGQGRIADLAREVPANARVLITYGGGSVVKTGTLAEVKTALDGYTVLEFGGIEPNPTYETLMQAVELARREKIDFLLAVGGGSVIDGTKFIAAAIPFAGEPWDILAKRAKIGSAIPLGSVLTLPATGSEMNSGAVITKRATDDKLAFSNPKLFPRFSVLDPTKTYTLPPRQVANGVVDAFVHIVEQYLTYPVDAKVQDRFAEGLLLTLVEDGPKALQEPENYDVRANLMWTATLALNGLIGVGVPNDWATHMGSTTHRRWPSYSPPCCSSGARKSGRSCCNTPSASGTCATATRTPASIRPSSAPASSSNRCRCRPVSPATASARTRFRPWSRNSNGTA
jgi:NADP-dependent alcohol dehydrogenase